MPRLSIWIIRAALLHLGIGFTVGALLLCNKGIPIEPDLWRLLPLHREMLLIGWLIQLTVGAAYWILPRWQTDRRRVGLVALAFALLNSGVLLAGSASWLPDPDLALATGRAAELLAVLAFAIHAWPRLKPLGSSQ